MMTVSYQKPNKQELRKFGLLFGTFFGFVLGLLIPFFRHGWAQLSEFGNWPVWPWVVSAIIIVWALIHSGSLFLLHRPWMKFADITGWINTRIIMLILFYFLILPVGLVMRFLGHDPMRRKFDSKLPSYRIMSKSQDKDHMKTPY